jgi:pimeloyl-ACP methyl ester carboxylesterase
MGDYVNVNGVHTYFEVSGAGRPLVLLHGGLGGVHSWIAQVPTLAERYEVFVPEQRGRGHTPDVEGAITYQVLAEDTIAFLQRSVAEPAHVVGASDGGIIGLLVAMQRPDLLRRLVTIGTNFHREGLLSGSSWTDLSPEDDSWAMPRQRYQAVSPDGADHWSVIFGKLQRMWQEEPTLTVGDLANIPIPVLVMVGDDDAVVPTHTIALYEALPLGELAVIPGTSHAAFMEKPELVNRLILDFLSEEVPPKTLLPIRRARSVRP